MHFSGSTAMEPQDLEMPDFTEYTPEVGSLTKSILETRISQSKGPFTQAIFVAATQYN